MRRSSVDPTKATRRQSGVGGHTIRVGANRGRYPTATGRLESSTPRLARRAAPAITAKLKSKVRSSASPVRIIIQAARPKVQPTKARETAL